MRGATAASAFGRLPIEISIHAPREGSDFSALRLTWENLAFQSTLPVRGATVIPKIIDGWNELFQSTLPVRGATGYV